MRLYIINHGFHYELENLCRVFFPNDKIDVTTDAAGDDESDFIYTELAKDKSAIKLTVKALLGGCDKYAEKTLPADSSDDDCEREMALLMYGILTDYTEVTPPWGILTGVRPIKLMRRLIDDDGEEKAAEYFRDKLKVSDEKIRLAMITQRNEKKIIDLSDKSSFSLYISIPFCPSRCSYCSFVSQSIEKASHLIKGYVDKLCEEIEFTASEVNKLNLKLETVYIGGGTPTTLDSGQIKRIIDRIYSCFDMSTCREFTVEAGRPDTITEDKLATMLVSGVDRISINPQTLNDNILEKIGRRHTSAQTLDAFALARKCGFTHINMDLIAGLPDESLESFKSTIEKVISLEPESITVHTLAMKKSSALTLGGMDLYREDARRTSSMLEYGARRLTESGYHPYYLYRQSRMVGNLENVGWSKQGKDGLYNVYVMDETHTVIACGAGGVTKLKVYGGDYLERIFNFKYPYEYISRFNEIIDRKERIVKFYDEFF